MKFSQADLKAMFERNKQLASLNQFLGPNTQTPEDCHWVKPVPIAKPSKYRNVKVEHEGMKFDSKHELKCWQNLKLLEKAGEIVGLVRQETFELKVNGQKIGKFTPDFSWHENGHQIVADAKSEITRKETSYRLRKKLFEAIFAPLVIREL